MWLKNSTTALFVVTSQGVLGDSEHATGLYLAELVEPCALLKEMGVAVTVASPRGGPAPVDPCSRATDLQALSALAATTIPLAEVTEAYDIYLVVGGRGALWDLAASAELGGLLSRAMAAGKVVAAIGQGVAALLAVIDEQGRPRVRGRRLTASSDREEQETGGISALPFSLERQLSERGARVELAAPWSEKVVTDGRLITGQNPGSAPGVARAIVRMFGET